VILGLVLDAQGDIEKGRVLQLEALRLFQQFGDAFWTARAATNLGRSLRRLGANAEAQPYLQEALSIRRRLGDTRGVANTLHHLSDAYESNGEYALARSTTQESLELAQSVGDRFVAARALMGLGRQEFALGNSKRAEVHFDRAISLARRDEFGHEVVESAIYLALIARERNELSRTQQFAEEGLRQARSDGRKDAAARALYVLGDAALRRDQQTLAAAHFRESLKLYQAVPDESGVALALASLAGVIGPPDRAARLLEAATDLTDHPSQVQRSVDAWELKECRARIGSLPRAMDSRPPDAEKLKAIVAEALAS
jgi:tetratricopeptide (TPR) repeat protein